jgi:hypothetical protein
MYDLMRKSIAATSPKPTTSKRRPPGQQHLLYKNQKPNTEAWLPGGEQQEQAQAHLGPCKCPTRLLIRRRSLKMVEEGGGTHIYAIRYPEDTKEQVVSEQPTSVAPVATQEQCPPRRGTTPGASTKPLPVLEGADVFSNSAMASIPRQEGTYCRLKREYSRKVSFSLARVCVYENEYEYEYELS